MINSTKLGLGTFPLANVFGSINEIEIERILHLFYEAGGRHLDTAPLYGSGKVEEILGLMNSRFPRNQFKLSTKCGYSRSNRSEAVISGRPGDIIEGFDASLRRLRSDFVEVLVLHRPDSNIDPAETAGAMAQLKKAGKVRHLGISNVTLPELIAYNVDGTYTFLQQRCSFLNLLEDNLLTYCRKHKIKIVGYQALERGLFTNRILEPFKITHGDLRNSKQEFRADVVAGIRKWIYADILPIASELDTSIEILALWWTIMRFGLEACLVGVTSQQQILNNLKVGEFFPPSDTLDRLNKCLGRLPNLLRGESGT
ncbi:MAG: aldo/keto reductase [Pyrinomonadaceae bacterium]